MDVDHFVRVIGDAHLIERHAFDRIVFEDIRDARDEMCEHMRSRFARCDAVFSVELPEHGFGLLLAHGMEAVHEVAAAADLDDPAQERVVARVDDDIRAVLEDAPREDAGPRLREQSLVETPVGMADLIARAQVAFEIARRRIGLRAERAEIDRSPRRKFDRVLDAPDDARANDSDIVLA